MTAAVVEPVGRKANWSSKQSSGYVSENYRFLHKFECPLLHFTFYCSGCLPLHRCKDGGSGAIAGSQIFSRAKFRNFILCSLFLYSRIRASSFIVGINCVDVFNVLVLFVFFVVFVHTTYEGAVDLDRQDTPVCKFTEITFNSEWIVLWQQNVMQCIDFVIQPL